MSLLIYLPVINNSFVSDDFLVLKKLAIDQQLNLDGFFRPLSDITLYLTYRLFGLNPLPYYLTGVILHALNALLVFHYCLRWNWTIDKALQQRFALLAAALFLTYPFHNESVAWILGRGALMANTLGLVALLMLTGNAGRKYKMVVVCLCYYVGLAAYETIMPLPVMVLLFVISHKEERRHTAAWFLWLLAALLLHLATRFVFSGAVTGAYGAAFFQNSPLEYGSRLLKAMARLLLPPSDQVSLMIVLFCCMVLLLTVAMIILWKKVNKNDKARTFLLLNGCFLLVSMLIPVVGAVSTRTSESDRFLHFPSYFVCILAAFALVQLVKDRTWQMLAFSILVIYQLVFLEKNNGNWEKASVAVREILSIVDQGHNDQKIYVVNLPDEVDGAYIFRNGFKDALLLNNIDTGTVVVASRLTRDEALTLPPVLQPQLQDGRMFIPPSYNVQHSSGNTGRIVYWNKKKWVIF